MYNLSKSEEDFLRQSNLIEDAGKNIEQASIAWKFLKDTKELSNGVICYTHKILMIDKPYPPPLGYYRDIIKKDVTIGGWGGRLAPSWGLIEGLMGNWLLDYRELGWREAHIRFEHIHPFYDGNGRVGRMLMNWQRLQEGLPILVIKAKEKEAYYEWFQK
jgi:hypothetical protein